MKKLPNLFLLATLYFFSSITFAQCDYCNQILEKGIFNQFDEYSDSDFRDFLDIILTKDKTLFTSEYNKNSSSKGADAAYGVYSAGYDEDNLSVSDKRRLELIKTFYARNNKITNSDRQFISRKTASQSIAASWERCVLNCGTSGLIIKSDGDPNGDEFIVSVEWLPDNRVEAEDKEGILIKNVQVTNGSIVGDGNLKKNEVLMPFGSLVTKIKRSNPENDLIISISTDKYGVRKKNINKVVVKHSNDLPVGTIIQSVLPYKDFMNLNDQSPVFSNESLWAPCDGRRVPIDAKYRIYADNTPDLRGVFIRGLNSFYPNDEGTQPILEERKDIDGIQRRANSFQNDTLKSHSHNYTKTHGFGYKTGEPRFEFFGNGGGPTFTETGTSLEGGVETRPKNVAVYFFIKIN